VRNIASAPPAGRRLPRPSGSGGPNRRLRLEHQPASPRGSRSGSCLPQDGQLSWRRSRSGGQQSGRRHRRLPPKRREPRRLERFGQTAAAASAGSATRSRSNSLPIASSISSFPRMGYTASRPSPPSCHSGLAPYERQSRAASDTRQGGTSGGGRIRPWWGAYGARTGWGSTSPANVRNT
jgi:hypothetical protein